ncbi:MAG: hypothetical protein IJ565_06120 [Bacilli bacterium]|nr:hypothetical protein [Bacilli bacterium]
MINLLKKYKIIIALVNIIIFIVLYFVLVYSIKKEYNYDNNVINLYDYSEKINIDNLEDIFLKVLRNIVINNNLLFEDNVVVQISKNNLHRRGLGEVSIFGEYKSNDELEKIIKKLDSNIDIDTLLDKRKLSIYNDEKTICILFLESSNHVRINFRTKLPYSFSDNYTSSNEFEKYYFLINEKNHLTIKNKIKSGYVKILSIIVSINLVCLIFLAFKSKKMTNYS